MNQRIRLLADQILPNEKEFHQGNPKEWGYFFSGDELEKFAELIVRECSGFVYNYPEKYLTRNQSAEICMSMEEHFGITE